MFDAIRKAVQFVSHTAHQAAEAVTDRTPEPKAAAPTARRDTAEFRRQLPSPPDAGMRIAPSRKRSTRTGPTRSRRCARPF